MFIKVCREQFVAMHSEPVLENVAQSFLKKFGYEDTNDWYVLQTTAFVLQCFCNGRFMAACLR